MHGPSDDEIRQALSAALLRDLGLRASAIYLGRSDDGLHAAAGVHVAADRSELLDARLDAWSEQMSQQLSKEDFLVTVYALARCCGG